jgi:hypothetical protein
MGAHQRRRTSIRANRTRPPERIRRRLRARPAPRLAQLIACCLAGVALCLFLLPAVALSATTAQIFPSFAGGKPGTRTAIRFRFAVTDSAGGIPQAPVRAIVHLPNGTGLGLARLPKADLCSSDILQAANYGPPACPKGSHAGPVGSAHLEAIVGGQPTIVRARLYPVVVGLHGGGRALAMLLESPAPFPSYVISLVPNKNELMMSLESIEVSPGQRSAIIDLSMALGESAGITMPARCPTGGFKWRTDFSYWEGPDTTALATSPCPGKGTRASTQPSPRMTTSQVAQAAQAPKTAFQCEKRFHGSQARSRCFNQLPGANCAHPLEAQTAGPTHRGDTRDLTVTDNEEPEGENVWQFWSWKPKNKNVAICPYPNGVVYRVSLLWDRTHCQRIHGEEICSSEYDTKTMREHTTRFSGEFKYHLTHVAGAPRKGFYLAVKGYYIHPPWERTQ